MGHQAWDSWKEERSSSGWRDHRRPNVQEKWGGNNGSEWSKRRDKGSSWGQRSQQKSWADWGSSAAKNEGRCESGSSEDASTTICGDAKLRLVRLRRALEAGQAEALENALKRKRDECPLHEPTLGPEILADVNTILEKDTWDGAPTGRQWLWDWLQEGVDWAAKLEETKQPAGEEYYCLACWKACFSDREMEKHKQTKDHRKRQRTWSWRYGVAPEAAGLDDASASGSGNRRVEPSPEATGVPTASGASKAVAELLRKTSRINESPVASAKRRLLEYRNSLTCEQRQAILTRIGYPRANDVGSLRELQECFDHNVASDLKEVACERGEDRERLDWICKEPTFSWLSGFYWHPDATKLEQQGTPHGDFFCHLCESPCWSQEELDRHKLTRRHAENALRWAEQMGNMEHPSHCGRCADSQPSCSSKSWGSGQRSKSDRDEDRDLDLEHRRSSALPDPEVKPETTPPRGFRDIYRGDKGKVLAVPYVSVAAKVDRRAHAVKLVSRLPIGPKEKQDKYQGRRQDKRWYVELFWCLYSKTWKSLAIPLPMVRPGESLDFSVSVQWSEGEKAPWEELDERLSVQVPRCGEVAVLHADLLQCSAPGGGQVDHQSRYRGECSVWVDCKPILDFVGRGQVDAAGGISELRGTQRPMQFATEDVMMSFLFWVPETDAPAPVLLFFHGDMPRSTGQCPQPGLADFAPTYGPAQLVVEEKKRSHPVRDFVVFTPCCSEDVWWLRYPANHDSTSYAESVERCLRGMVEMSHDLGLSRRQRGVCFAGQSMGAYMALEMARAMPEETAAVFAGAPCFDACRLNHLAERLVNVPLWLLIGRNDTLCSYEEVASLALKMKDLDCKCVRLTSVGIKGHSEVGKKLEKWELFEWLRNPLGRGAR